MHNQSPNFPTSFPERPPAARSTPPGLRAVGVLLASDGRSRAGTRDAGVSSLLETIPWRLFDNRAVGVFSGEPA
jgi:hypothetical protein